MSDIKDDWFVFSSHGDEHSLSPVDLEELAKKIAKILAKERRR